jgi:hydrogenase-4 component E
LGILTAGVRGIAIPTVVVRSLHTTPHRAREQQPVIPTATSIIISLGIVLFSYALYTLGIGTSIDVPTGFLPLALLFQGGFLIVSRRNAFIQLAGYLSMENAVLLFGSMVFPGFPFIVEAGVILDLLGVVVVSRIIMRLRESSDSGGTYGSKELRG